VARQAKLCEEAKICSGGIPLYRWGRIGASLGRLSVGALTNRGISVIKLIVVLTTAFCAALSTVAFFSAVSTVAFLVALSAAAAADLPRKEPPPVAAVPVGKYPIGKYPVGKYPVGKYPQPVVTKG